MQDYFSWIVTFVVIIGAFYFHIKDNKKQIEQKVFTVLAEYKAECISTIKELIRAVEPDDVDTSDFSTFQADMVNYLVEEIYDRFNVWLACQNENSKYDDIYKTVFTYINDPKVKDDIIKSNILKIVTNPSIVERLEEKYDYLVKQIKEHNAILEEMNEVTD